MTKNSNSIEKIVSVLLALLLFGIIAAPAVAVDASATIRVYGEDDCGPGTNYGSTNPVQPHGPNIYSDEEDAFDPTVISKDSITFNPAIIPWDGTNYPMSADGLNIDVKKFLRIWYEPNHTYNGRLNNPTYHPTIEVETTYMLVENKHFKPTTGSKGLTTFAFPIAEKDNQIGLGSFDANIPKDGTPDLVSLNLVSGSGTAGTIEIQKTFMLNVNQQIQFLDHKLRYVGVYTDPSDSNIKRAKIEVSYAGNLNDDSAKITDLGNIQTFFDRHNNPSSSVTSSGNTWYARFISFNGNAVQITVGKRIRAGDTFYVNSVRYDVPAVYVPAANSTFKYITLRTPLPKGTNLPREESVVSSQWISEIPVDTIIPINPPFNQENGYRMVDDTNVALWEPTENIDEWPTGPFPEGERYLTQRSPDEDWIDYFDAEKIMVKDTLGNDQWIADEVNGRIIDATTLEFKYLTETIEPRLSTDLLEILNESTVPESWRKYVIQTRPDQYTEFLLPTRPDVILPPSGRYDLDDAYKGDYLATLHYNIRDENNRTALRDSDGARVAFSYDPENGIDPYVNKLTDPLVRIYGEADQAILDYDTDTNTVNSGSVGIYNDSEAPFNPAIIRKDSVTFNPAIVLWDGQDWAMSADSINIDVKKYLRMWYEPDHTYNGFLDNPTYHPTIELESTYMLIDSKHKLPIAGSAGTTTFAFPIKEAAGQIGVGAFDGLVDLASVRGNGTHGTIRLEKNYNLGVGDKVQFLDHKLTFVGIFEDPAQPTKHYAKVTVEYAGNLNDDTARTVDLGSKAGDPVALTFFDRHNDMWNESEIDHANRPDRTWYAKLDYYSIDCTTVGGVCKAQITIGKEISAGDTYYVNSVRYDVRAVFVPDGTTKFKYITISTPLPKGDDVPLEASTVTSQWITEIPPDTTFPVNPPFNGVYDMVDDINVILWQPAAHIDEWPTGPFAEGERYLTMQSPDSAWKDYFDATEVMVQDTLGRSKWIAYEVNGRIILDEEPLNFSYVDETFERRYSTDLLEILNESTTPESWKWYDIQTMPDQYTEFKLPPRTDLDTYVPGVENWGDYLITLSWFSDNSKDTEHNLLHPGSPSKWANWPRVAFVYDAVDSTGLYVNERTETPPTPPNQLPTCAIVVSPGSVQSFETVTADPTGTYDPNGDPITLSFDWGDGTVTNTTSAVAVTHQYTLNGSYNVVLSVSDGTQPPSPSICSAPVTVTDDGVKISFMQGWNQISVPITTGSALGGLFAGVPGYTQTWAWNKTTQAYESVGLLAPEAGRGYFVYASAPKDVIIRGTAVFLNAADIQASLATQWNMVGPGFTPIILPGWQWAYNLNPATNSYGATTTIVPPKGYWIYKT